MAVTNTKTKENPLEAMPKGYYEKLIKLLYVQASRTNEKFIWKYLCEWLDLHNISHETDSAGNILVTKGKAEIYPAVCSHMDTVHDIHKDFKLFYYKDKDGNIILSASSGDKQVGIAGDDKCGIFSCLYMLETFENIKCVFFTQEEGGCKGAGAIDKTFFDDVGYLIEPDRWGSSDFICKTYGSNTVSEEYLEVAKPILDKFKYVETSGLMTDSISLFDDDLGISCVNVSCGYYQHHSDQETIDVNELWHSVKFVKELIETLGNKRYEQEAYKYVPVKTYSNVRTNYNDDYYNDAYADDYSRGYYGKHYGSGTKHDTYTKSKPSLYNKMKYDFSKETILEILGEKGLTFIDLYNMDWDSLNAVDICQRYLTITNTNLLRVGETQYTHTPKYEKLFPVTVYDCVSDTVDWIELQVVFRNNDMWYGEFDKIKPEEISYSKLTNKMAKEYKAITGMRLFKKRKQIKHLLTNNNA